MGTFTVFRWAAWIYWSVVNDLIFTYNIAMFIAWAVFNLLNPGAFAVVYSLYLELDDLTKIQDLARLKVCLILHWQFMIAFSVRPR
jgi:hypothetical protein